MSDDLVRWLRKRAEHSRSIDGTGLAKQLDVVADRIEALEAEVAEANRIVKTYYVENERLEAANEAAEARAEKLRRTLREIAQTADQITPWCRDRSLEVLKGEKDE